jgi:predicted nucleic acid-binding protein
MRLVLDASVAVKWLVAESDSPLADWKQGRVELVAPSLLLAEVANALWKKVIRDELDSGRAACSFSYFRLLNLPLVPVERLVADALDFSFFYNHPVYDCAYLALAVREQCLVLTADEKFFNLVSSPILRTVRLLRDWTSQGVC